MELFDLTPSESSNSLAALARMPSVFVACEEVLQGVSLVSVRDEQCPIDSNKQIKEKRECLL